MENQRTGCVKCGYRGWILSKDGKKEFCTCRIKRKMATYLQGVSPYTSPGKATLSRVTDLDTKKNLYMSWREPDHKKVHGLLSYLLVQEGLTRSYAVLDIYRLVDIWFGQEPNWKSVLDLQMDVLILLMGYGEAPNKDQPTLIIQTLENRGRLNKTTWIFVKGGSLLYPPVFSWVREAEYTLIDFDVNNSKKQKISSLK